MSIKLPTLSEGQIKVLYRTMVRAGEAVPDPGPDFLPWLKKSQLVVPAGILVGRMQAIDPLKMELRDEDFRKYTLGYMTGFDCFTRSRAQALETFLNNLEKYPNMPIETKRLKITLRDMNRQHRDGVHQSWSAVDRAYQRFNENIGLGRPTQTALQILFDELYKRRVFSGGTRAHEGIYECYQEIDEILQKVRAGKNHPENLVRASITRLENLVTAAFQAESQYWYNEVMVKQYVRDTLIPNAVLNGYLDPQQTSDLLGAVWNFITDLPLDPKLLVCIPTLRHQPQKQGPRYASTADFMDEIKLGKIIVNEFPVLKERLTERQAEILDPDMEEPALSMLSEHPLIRISHGPEYLPFLLARHCKEVNLETEKFEQWLDKSIFSIDPRNGIPAQGLALALRMAAKEFLEPTMEKAELLEEMQDLYFRILDNKFQIAIESLQAPFESDYLEETRMLDPFELYEALIDLMLAGFYQPHSDWEEEVQLAEKIASVVPVITKGEKDDDMHDIPKFQELFEEVADSLEVLRSRAELVKFDIPSLRMWKIFSIDLLRKLNQIKRKQFFRMSYSPDLMVAVNRESLEELIEGKLEDEIYTSLEEIAAL